MPITPHDVDTLKRYVDGVMSRAGHHAGQVSAAALALLGPVLWRADPGSIELRTQDDKLANMLWFNVGTKRYALLYAHRNLQIELRERTQQGSVLHSFDNTTSLSQIHDAFTGL